MDFDKFLAGYLECALWSSTDDAGNPLDDNYDVDDLSEGFLASSREECRDFFDANRALMEQAQKEYHYLPSISGGHDFWLTRNRHGAGFWDRGMGEVGQKLTEAAHVYGSVDLYVGDNGRIYGG